jgi:hypothetical protein
MTKGEFGFHRGGGQDETGTAAYVQIYVKSSALSRAPDLAISAHLMTEAEIDQFMDDGVPTRIKPGYNKEVGGINPYPAIPSRLPSWRNARSRRSCRYARRHAR